MEKDLVYSSSDLKSKSSKNYLSFSKLDLLLMKNAKYFKYIESSIILLIIVGLVSLFCVEFYFYSNHPAEYYSLDARGLSQLGEYATNEPSRGIAPDTITAALKLKN